MLMKNSVIWRMLTWFLLMALIPLGIVVFFIQNQVNESILDSELQAASREALTFAAESANHSVSPDELSQVFGAGGEIPFILGNDGTYLAHYEEQKIGSIASNDFNADMLEMILSGENDSFDNETGGQIIGYAPIPGRDAVAVIVKDRQPVVENMRSLSYSILIQLSVTLLITSVISGVAILVVINPLRKLASFADQLGSGNLDTSIETTDLEGEIAVLAGSLKSMGSRLRDLILNLENRIRERTRDLQIASQVASEITQVLNLDELLPHLVKQTQEGFELYFVSVYLYEASTRQLVLAAGTGQAGEQMKKEGKVYSIDAVPSLIAQAGRERQPVVIDDVTKSEAFFPNPYLPETHSEAAIPMLVQDDLVGVLGLQSVKFNYFTESGQQIMVTLAEQIGVAVKNAQLYEDITERTHDLQIVSEVSRDVTQVLKLDELLPRLVEKTKEGFGLYFASLYLYDSSSQRLVLEAGTGEGGKVMKVEGKAYSIDAFPSLIAQAGREQQAVVINDVTQSDAHYPNPHLPETRSEAAIPMLFQNELVGVLGVQSIKTDHFQKTNLQTLFTLAEQIAVAITNARLYEEQLQVVEQLRKVDAMKSQFLASMSHELRTPMNAIINFVEMVAAGLIGPINPEQKELLEQSLQSSKHLLHLINDVLDISKIQADRLTLFVEEDVNIREEIKSVLDMASPLIKEKIKSLQIVTDIDEDLPIIAGDKRRIRQILLNLLSNAIKFTEKGTVTLSVKNQGNQLILAVIDTGPGIPEEAQTMIFDPFVQGADGIKQTGGTGLGLPIARSLVQAHGGKLWLESEPGEGAAFYFSLPVNSKSGGSRV